MMMREGRFSFESVMKMKASEFLFWIGRLEEVIKDINERIENDN